MSNQAAWLPAKGAPYEIKDAPMPTLGPHEILVRIHAVALNPADYAVAKMGIVMTEWPGVNGCDGAGEVQAVGDKVTRFKAGDRVTGCADYSVKRANVGTFQKYCALPDGLCAKIPDNISYAEGCVLPLAMATAAHSLYEKVNLALPFPTINAERADKVLVVWGGSSSVGSCAIQMAKASGFDVATTCSSHNIEYCKSLGAKWIFDHKKENVVEEIVDALKGKTSAGVFDAVMYPDTLFKSAEIAHRLDGNKFLATVLIGPPHMAAPEGLPVKVGYSYSTHIKDSEVGPAVYGEWLTATLESGTMKCKPDPEIVGKGLEAIPEAVEKMGAGVSGSKLVVEVV